MLLGSTDRPLVELHDLIMFDLDGVVYRGAQAVPHAVESILAVQGAGVGAAYLTNNASRTADEVAVHLRSLGIAAADVDVVTAGAAIAHLVAAAIPPGSTVLVVGGPGLRLPLEAAGLRCTDAADDGVVAVVQGFHPDVGWRNLAEASYAIGTGAVWFASNADLTVPTGRGVAPGNGSLIEAVSRATGTSPSIVAGKPEAGIFTEAIERTGASCPLMVGDRLDTDIAGAARLGIDSLQVLTGVHGLRDLVELPPDRRPTYVASDLRSLHVEHPPVLLEPGRASCGQSVARIDDDLIDVIEGVPGTLASIRAVVGLAWSLFDETGQPPRLASRALEH
jgi:glycerol 3-phosphatase-2